MGNIVIAMPKIEDAHRIGNIIRNNGIYCDILFSSSGSDTLGMIGERDIGLVICGKKLCDMGYEELSSYLPFSVNMILLTKDASLVPFSSNIVRLLLPFRSGDLINTINMLMPEAFYRPKKKKPVRSLEEQKTIDDAKELLMSRNHMTEPEAFRYIQKLSMDQGRTLVESAQMVIMLNSE